MRYDLPVAPHITEVIAELQRKKYASYVVGGAVRDLLLGRRPHDYDIATAATPEQIREALGRRRTRIIGKRFRLVHLHLRDGVIEISTFRRAPEVSGSVGSSAREDTESGEQPLPKHLILSDNNYGTEEEDAWRRDFTVNALLYDPVNMTLKDHTGCGRSDIERGVVRAIGDASLRFEEDPVRVLRALKLVGQYDFSLDSETENALFASLPLIRHTSGSRLALELEKILCSSYGDKHLQAFHDYGFLSYFLPQMEVSWDSPAMEYALRLLAERNCRVDEGLHRNSVSLAMAALALPFVESEMTGSVGALWPEEGSLPRIRTVLSNIFLPQKMMKCMYGSAERILGMQVGLKSMVLRDRLVTARSYPHARELAFVQNAVCWHDETLEKFWPLSPERRAGGRRRRKSRRN